MRRHARRFVGTLGVIAIAIGAWAPAAGAGGGGDGGTEAPEGITETEITISVISGFTGPVAALNENAYEGLQTWADDLNADSGVFDRQVKLVKVDHKETADGGVAACKEALSNGSFMVVVPEGVEANLTAVDCLDEAGMPTLYFAGNTDPDWQYAFSYIPTAVSQGKSVASYIKNVLKDGDKKIGVLYQNTQTPEAGANAFTKRAKKLGLDVVAEEAVEQSQTTFVPQLQRLKDAGAEVVFLAVVNEALGIFRDAQTMGYDATFTGGGFTFDFLSTALKDAMDGASGLRFGAAVDSDVYAEYEARMEANGRGRDRTEDQEGFLFYGLGLLLEQVLTAAGENPTRESLVAGAETIKGYDNGILPPITYGPDDHVGTTASFPVVCCNDDFTWQGKGKAKAKF
jgi:ABC-type branched-subunit amino acid transport system substrate-binding protein